MRLRLLKLSCLVLVLALAGGLIVFNFAGEDLRSALIQTSSVTPATDFHVTGGLGGDTSSAGVAAGKSGAGAKAPQAEPGGQSVAAIPPRAESAAPTDSTLGNTAQPGSGSGENTAFAPSTPATAPTQAQPAPDDTLAINPSQSTPPQTTPGETRSATASQPTAPDTTSDMVASAAAPPLSAQPQQGEASASTAAAGEGATAAAAGPAPGTKTASTPSETAKASTASMAPHPSAPDSSSSAISDRSKSEDVTSKIASSDTFPAAIAPTEPEKAAGGTGSVEKPTHAARSGGAPEVTAESAEEQPAAAPSTKPARLTPKHRAKHRQAAVVPPPAPATPRKSASASRVVEAAPSVQATQTPQSPPTPHRQLLAQVTPPASAASARSPLAPATATMPRPRGSDFASRVAIGPQMLIEFPSLKSKSSGTLAGSGSVTNSSARVIPGIVGSWTSAPVSELPFNPRFGGSLFIGAPASGDSVATATTSGGYTLKLGQKNNWPVIMPRFFMGVPVADGTRASLGTGIWVNNVKETATLANGSGTQSDVHSGVTMRPFLSAAIEQRAPLFGFLPTDAQELKLSGGYIFGDTNFQAGFCASGQTCVRTSDQGSWFLGLSFEMGFPVAGKAAR